MRELVRHRLWPQVGSCLMPGADNPRMSSWYRRRTKEGGSPGPPAPQGISGRTADWERARCDAASTWKKRPGEMFPSSQRKGATMAAARSGPFLPCDS